MPFSAFCKETPFRWITPDMNHAPQKQEFSKKRSTDKVSSIFERTSRPGGRSVRLAIVGTYAPRKCGIATFTTDLREKLNRYHGQIDTDVYALDEMPGSSNYENLAGVIAANDAESYAWAARKINESGADAVWIQHEFGIFGGNDGEFVCHFIDRLAAPLIVTFHTVLSEPSERQFAIMRHLLERASRVMVMSRHSRELLLSRYRARPDIVDVIEHGAPDRPFGRQAEFKARLGLSDRKVLMTFGLLGRGKGIEHVIEAMPTIIASHPDVIYRVVGATHPNLIAREGEAYRDRLMALAERLGVADHIEWDNRFLETDELVDQLEACEIYITPYPGLQQSTSGTLSYAVALGKAVVSTPYLHARELLAEGVGLLIEPDSSCAIADAITGLLDNPDDLHSLQRRAWARGRETIWPRFADAAARLVTSALAPADAAVPVTATPGLSAVLAMSDATGMLQHSVGVVPDRRHGYCLDDNARALMLMNVVEGLDAGERLRWTQTFAAFVQHAWNPDAGRFRNFMRFDRSWCEDAGSEDSNGRALWALGSTAASSRDTGLSDWAMKLYDEVLPQFASVESPRAVAFAMLGACAVLSRLPDHQRSRDLASRGADLLERLLCTARRPDWAWFEAVLGYDNPRLSQALIQAGEALDRQDWIGAGLDSLEWICRQQVSSQGQFRPIGSESFGRVRDFLPFDQQPLEAQAAIEAARAAYAVTGGAFWRDHAMLAWKWFFGANDRGVVLADIVTGRCRDGVTPRGANENCGAESILAFQLSHYSMLGFMRTATESRRGVSLEPARETSA